MSNYIYGPSFVDADFVTSGGIISRERLKYEVYDAIDRLPWIQLRGSGCDVRFDAPTTTEEDDAIAVIVAAHSGDPWGTTDEAQRAHSDDVSTNSTTTFATKLSTTLNPVVIGAYRISWFAEGRRGEPENELEACEIQVECDAEILCVSCVSGSYWGPVQGFCCVDLQEADTPTITMKFRQAASGSYAAEIRRARIIVDRVSSCAVT